jgi:transposase
MPKTRSPYSPEFRRQMVDLVRAGRAPEDLAKEFEPTAQSIHHWVTVADRQEGRREEKADNLSSAERDELVRLRRENKQLRLERDILSRATAWFARETGIVPPGSSNS